uniref:Sorting nexin 19 n=1 Tax=Tetraodon nigroviridis TaxID=99883 RepID=H3DA50_TETNG
PMTSRFDPEGPGGQGMAEALVRRSLLAGGLLLAWLLLFHLLLNIWLLCVLASLLVALGGWLTSHAILESNNLVHLERFIRLEQIPSTADDRRRLDQEIRSTVRKIIRDFVTSWFATVSSEGAFEGEVQAAMIAMAAEMKTRAAQVDRKDLTRRVLDLVGCHLRDFIQAEELLGERRAPAADLWTAYGRVATPHPAASDRALEVQYARAAVDLLLQVLVPWPHLESRTGRFVVAELITCNVLLPLVAKLSEPDWLNGLIVHVCGGPAEAEDPLDRDPPAVRPAELAPPRTSGVPPEAEWTESSGGAAVPPDEAEEEPGGGKPHLCDLENGSEADSPSVDCKQTSTDAPAAVGQEEALYAAADGSLDLEEACPSPGEADGLPPAGTGDGPHRDGGSPLGTPSRELLLSVEHSSPGEVSEVSPPQSSSPLPSFSFEPLSSPEGPVLIQNLRITGTITAKEHRGTGSHPYTLYTIKYETALGCESAGGLPPGPEEVEAVLSTCEPPSSVAYHTVNRRYSEFLNLQTRLEEKAELRKLIKGVKGPKKVFPDMPFGNMDSERIEARKGLLEAFLKHLCAMSEIANSEEMQEFLALNTDARIAFVKKPFIVSRIDKIVVNAIVDTLKTAFPRPDAQSPTEDEAEVDGLKTGSDKKSRSRLRFSGRSVPFADVSEVRPLRFSCEQRSTVFGRMSLEELERFIAEQEDAASGAEPEPEERPGHGQVLDVRLGEKRCPEPGSEPGSETALAEAALSILGLLTRKQWSWLCTENVHGTVRLLFGTLLNRWLDVSVANLTSTRSWVVYLQGVQEAVWPGGQLPAEAPPRRSRRQKDDTRREALRSLMSLLPGVLVAAVDPDKYRRSWRTFLDSLQNGHINKHLVFCLLDLLLELLVPEVSDQDFQNRLMEKLSRSPERSPM